MIRNLFFMLCLVAVAALVSCESDPINCEDKQIGDVFFEPVTKGFLPFDGTEKLIFRDSANAEITFTCAAPNTSRIPLNVEKLCDGTDLAAHYKFMLADFKSLEFKTSDGGRAFTMGAQMTSYFVSDNIQDTALYELCSATMFANLDGGSELYVVTSTRGNLAKLPANFEAENSKFRAIADTTILGTPFSGLMEGLPVWDTAPTNHVAIYLKSGQGIVAFKDADGKMWVLDRVE